MARRLARELAFRALFQAERGGSPLLDVWREVRADLGDARAAGDDEDAAEAYGDALDADAIAFADAIVREVDAHGEAIDAELEDLVVGWTFGQMSQTDLNVLRLAVAELRYLEGIPPRVTLEMAVRLAKRFGGEDSGRFVNGVLAKLYRALPPGPDGDGVGDGAPGGAEESA